MTSAILVNPNERNILENAGDRPPLGMLYIGTWLEKKGHDIKIIDLNHDSLYDLARAVYYRKPDLIGVSCYTSPAYDEALDTVKQVRSMISTKIVMGGYHASIMPHTLKDANNVIIGEAEYAMDYLINNELDFKVYGKSMNLESMSLPNRYLLDMSKYNLTINGIRTGTMMTSRGCPQNCSFCGNLNRMVRYNNLKDINLEIESLKQFGYKQVYILDDVFTIKKDRANQISKMLKENNMQFRCTTRANYLNEEVIETLAKNGCITISMGIESGNEEILKRCGKGQNLEQITEAVNLCGEYKIPVKGFFILGLPGENEQTARDTINYAENLRKIGLKSADFYPLIPYPGTDIFENSKIHGIKIIDYNWRHYLQATRNEIFVPCETKDLKAERIKQLIKEARDKWK